MSVIARSAREGAASLAQAGKTRGTRPRLYESACRGVRHGMSLGAAGCHRCRCQPARSASWVPTPTLRIKPWARPCVRAPCHRRHGRPDALRAEAERSRAAGLPHGATSRKSSRAAGCHVAFHAPPFVRSAFSARCRVDARPPRGVRQSADRRHAAGHDAGELLMQAWLDSIGEQRRAAPGHRRPRRAWNSTRPRSSRDAVSLLTRWCHDRAGSGRTVAWCSLAANHRWSHARPPTLRELRSGGGMRASDPAERLRSVHARAGRAAHARRRCWRPRAPAWRSTTSTPRRATSTRPLRSAPEWAAAHFERGKLWLRADDMERASESFRAAADRMPRFGSAWANLGATLGRARSAGGGAGGVRAGARRAIRRAIRRSTTSAWSGASWASSPSPRPRFAASSSSRRIWRLAITISATRCSCRAVIRRRSSAYVEGQKRDPERNPVQATRLAMCRLATGDARGAIGELRRAISGLAAGVPAATAGRHAEPSRGRC